MTALPFRRLPLLLAACGLATAACAAPRAGNPPPPDVAAAGAPAPSPPPAPLRFLGRNDAGHEEWWRPRDGAVVVRIPAGDYRRRPYQGGVATADPEPVHVPSFFMDKHEVTNRRFARFLAETGAPADTPLVRAGVPGLVHDGAAWTAAPGLEEHPVTACVGAGALAYAAWAGGTLPGPDHWMKAAGGADGRLFPWGDAPPDATRAVFGRPPRTGPEPVGSRPAGASPYGCLDMAGNVYERVLVEGRGGAGPRPVMLKGGAWLSGHPLNLRVLDLCMQPEEVAEDSVGFRCAMDDPGMPSPPEPAPAALRPARTFDAAVEEARRRRVPLFLSLLFDTCGQCDRTIAGCYRDPRFVAYANEHLVVLIGHQPGDAMDAPHPARADGTCTVHAGLLCSEHEEIFRLGLKAVGGFRVSPGNFVLDAEAVAEGRRDAMILVAEGDLPKWGDDVDAYLAAFRRAERLLRERARAVAPGTSR